MSDLTLPLLILNKNNYSDPYEEILKFCTNLKYFCGHNNRLSIYRNMFQIKMPLLLIFSRTKSLLIHLHYQMSNKVI